MAKLLVFSGAGFTGNVKEFRSNDPDLTLNGDDFIVASAIVAAGSWTLYDDVGYTGGSVAIGEGGGPDLDGTFKDQADWGGAAVVHVKSIQHA